MKENERSCLRCRRWFYTLQSKRAVRLFQLYCSSYSLSSSIHDRLTIVHIHTSIYELFAVTKRAAVETHVHLMMKIKLCTVALISIQKCFTLVLGSVSG